ncbi:MAG: ferredoxin [Candidatus Absconditabacterales bacterium]
MNVDQNLCIGCGTCVAVAGKDLIDFNVDNKAEVKRPAKDDAEKNLLQQAKDSCPVGAILD